MVTLNDAESVQPAALVTCTQYVWLVLVMITTVGLVGSETPVIASHKKVEPAAE